MPSDGLVQLLDGVDVDAPFNPYQRYGMQRRAGSVLAGLGEPGFDIPIVGGLLGDIARAPTWVKAAGGIAVALGLLSLRRPAGASVSGLEAPKRKKRRTKRRKKNCTC